MEADRFLQRLDVLEVINAAEEDTQMYWEAVLFLDGEKKTDLNLVRDAYLRHCSQYQQGKDKVERLKKEIRERKQQIEQVEETMSQHQAMTNMLGGLLRESSRSQDD